MIRTVLLTIISSTVMGCTHPDKQQIKEKLQTKNHKPEPLPDKSDAGENEDPLSAFVPENYIILDKAAGDLNLDSFPDMILILENNKSNTFDYPVRPLILLLGQADRSYKQSGRNDSVVLCALCGGARADPFQSIVIKNGYFSVEQYGGMNTYEWTRISTFKYSALDKYWYLYKDGLDEYKLKDEGLSKRKIMTTLKTVKDFGKIPFNKFDINKNVR